MNRIEDFHKKVDFSSKIDCRKRLSGVKISQETAELTKKIQEFSSPNDPMVNLTTEGGLLFMANRKSLTRYYNIDVIYTLAMEKEVIGQIDRAHNSVILSSVRLLLENRMGRRLRALENYIEQNFQEVWQDRERALWRWKTPVPAF